MKGAKWAKITKIGKKGTQEMEDLLVIEEPLEIRLAYGGVNSRQKMSLTLTMRTPGNDKDLAIGFLLAEGIIKSIDDILKIAYIQTNDRKSANNILIVELSPKVHFEVEKNQRHFYATASCGVCGKSSIESIQMSYDLDLSTHKFKFPSKKLFFLPQILKEEQSLFTKTGGLHAAALFDVNGKLFLIREDVGRHNAVDKLIGAAIQQNIFPITNYLVLVSGRIGFELVQKSIMAGVPIMAAVGAPSSLAVELAEEYSLTLVGFLRDEQFNIYTCPERINLK